MIAKRFCPKAYEKAKQEAWPRKSMSRADLVALSAKGDEAMKRLSKIFKEIEK